MNNSLKIVPIKYKDKNGLKKIKTIFHFINGQSLELCSTEYRSIQEQMDIIIEYVNARNVVFKDCYINLDKVTHIEWEEFDESDAPKQRNIDKFRSKLATIFKYTIGFCFSIYILTSAIIYLMQLIGD